MAATVAVLAGPGLRAQTPGEFRSGTLAPVAATPGAGPSLSQLPCFPPQDLRYPAVPVGSGFLTTAQGNPSIPGGGPVQPSAYTVYRNTVVKPAGALTSNILSTSTSHLGGAAFMVGNFFAASSANDGTTWTYINPFTKFGVIDGGFCCGQQTISSPAHNLLVWGLLNHYSSATRQNSFVLAPMVGAANVVAANAPKVYALSPQVLGFPAGSQFDSVHLARSNNYLFLSGSVFTSLNSFLGSIVIRIPFTQLAAGQTLTWNSFTPFEASPRCSSGVDDTMYFATHVFTTLLRVYAWPETGNIVSKDIAIGPWYGGMTPMPSPDQTNFLKRCDNRIATGYHNSREVGFYWTSNSGGAFPNPFVRGVRLDRKNGLAFLADENIWSANDAWAYPAAATNVAGHVALLCAFGGSVYPGCDVFLRDNVNCTMSENQTVAAGDAGPEFGFGEYFSVQRHPTSQMAFVVSAGCQRGGKQDANAEPHEIYLGRTQAAPSFYDLSVSSQVPSGATITVGTKDTYCEQSGTTPFVRTYAAAASVLLTAAPTLGARTFYRWKANGVDQPIGLATLSVSMTAAQNAVAVYGTFTTPLTTPFGVGCTGTGSLPNLTAGGPALIGSSVQHTLTNGLVGKPAVLAVGSNKTSWPPLTLPFVLPSTTCTLYCDQLVALNQVVPAGGVLTWTIPVPNTPTLLGGLLYFQNMNLDVGANRWNVTTSNAIEQKIGGWILN